MPLRAEPLTALTAAASLAAAVAAEPPPLRAARGTVEKAEKDALAMRPRGPDGKFLKGVTLTVTGTSKVTVLVMQDRGGKKVLAQRDALTKDLGKGQEVAVIDAEGPDGPVLLSAVVLPADGKE